jgi:FixJ family two-component response regulator
VTPLELDRKTSPARSRISVVDDDESVRESLPDLLRSFGFAVEAFASAEAFLESEHVGATDCLILDIAMPGMSGPSLQQTLGRIGHDIPIVFITAHTNEAVRDRVVEEGAVDCLLKPFSEATLMRAIETALGTPS